MTWVVLLGLSPAWAGSAPGGPERGRVLTWVAAITHRIGAQVCHQRPDRSLHWHGRPLSVCGRCTGLYVAGAVGLLAASIGRRRRSTTPVSRVSSAGGVEAAAERVGLDPRAGWLTLAGAPTLVAWALEVAGLWNPGTPLRALAAVPLGLAAGWLIARALDD